jgi:hypothetical protein
MESMSKKLPALPPGAPGRPKGNRYKEQFGVIVICSDENHQRQVYEALRIKYPKVKVVRT